jgi:hypothetical protein
LPTVIELVTMELAFKLTPPAICDDPTAPAAISDEPTALDAIALVVTEFGCK